MKKILIPIFGLCLSALSMTIASCNGSTKENTNSADSTIVQDTIQEELEEVADTFTSTDLTMFELRGNVKEMTMKDNKGVKVKVQFSKEGEATILKYYGTDCKVKRNGKGQITSIGTIVGEDSEDFYFTFKYNADGNIVEEHEVHPSWYTDYVSSFKGFNADNLPTKTSSAGGEGGQMDYDECSLSYPEKDSFGNWTTRKNKGKSWTTSLDVNENGDEIEISSPVERYSTTTTRVITYFSKEELNK